MDYSSGRIKNRYILLFDLILCFLAYIIVETLFQPIGVLPSTLSTGIILMSITPIIYCGVLILGRIYFIDWYSFGTIELLRLAGCCFVSMLLSVLTGWVLFDFGMVGPWFRPKVNLVANFMAVALIFGLRFIILLIGRYALLLSKRGKGKRILVIGSGRLALMFLKEVAQNPKLNYNVVGLIDDDTKKLGQSIHGAKVIGNRRDIKEICENEGVNEIIYAIYNCAQKDKAEILDICSDIGVRVNIIPAMEEALGGNLKIGKMREVQIDDLLERDPIVLENELVEEQIKGKVVMVTGGGGSIGSELCRQILKFEPERLVIVDIYENTTYELQNELEENFPNANLDVLIASVRDKKRLDSIFEKYKPDIVFHAAAHKHVPLMEFSPCEAIKNNVFGTYNTALCAIEHKAKRFVLISTDKAVNPTNVMGASKRMCEMVVQTMQNRGETDFVAVRFGNVLGSHGSVIPRFKKQIVAGGPVTVTHPEITRFFMTIPEAAQLVLQAGAYAEGGEIFVLDMGKPVKIADLASKLISLSGYKPGVDIEIKYTGLRPGEKLYEELLMSEEGLKTTRHSKIFVGRPIEINYEQLTEKLDKLKGAVLEDEETVKQIISEVVPTYQYKGRKTEEKVSQAV